MNHYKSFASVATAGKLALLTGSASAGGIGKVGTDSNTIALDQVGYPLEVLIPPISISDLNLNYPAGRADSNTGSLYRGEIKVAKSVNKSPRIDFYVSNIISGNNPMVVFLAYSTELGAASQWADLHLNLLLNRDKLHVIAAYRVEPNRSFNTFNDVTTTPLGIRGSKGNSVIIPVELSELSDAEFAQNQIYFQAVAIPVINNALEYIQAKVSDLDHYVILDKSQVTGGVGGSSGTGSTDSTGGLSGTGGACGSTSKSSGKTSTGGKN